MGLSFCANKIRTHAQTWERRALTRVHARTPVHVRASNSHIYTYMCMHTHTHTNASECTQTHTRSQRTSFATLHERLCGYVCVSSCSLMHTAIGTRELARAAFVSFRGRWGQNGPRGDTRSAAAHVLRFSEFEIWKQVLNGNTRWKLASGFVHVHNKCCTLRVSIVCSPRVIDE
jgi:hypothetical protein